MEKNWMFSLFETGAKWQRDICIHYDVSLYQRIGRLHKWSKGKPVKSGGGATMFSMVQLPNNWSVVRSHVKLYTHCAPPIHGRNDVCRFYVMLYYYIYTPRCMIRLHELLPTCSCTIATYLLYLHHPLPRSCESAL